MAVITLDDIEPFLPITLTPDQEDMVTTLIDLVEGELSEILNRPIQPVQTTERKVVNLTEPTLFLENTPVISVDSVTADGNPVPAGFYTVRTWGLDFGGFNTLAIVDPVIWVPSNSHFTWWQTPDVLILASGDYPQSVWTITYTAGLDATQIPVLKSVLIKAIRRQIGQVLRGFEYDLNTSMKVEDFSWSRDPKFLSGMVGSFTEAEMHLLDHLTHKNYAA